MITAHRRLSALAFSLAFLASVGGGQTADPHVLERLRELGRASAGVTTLRAHFEQEKRLSIVRDVLRSSGTFLLDKRGRVAWDVTEPDAGADRHHPRRSLCAAASASRAKPRALASSLRCRCSRGSPGSSPASRKPRRKDFDVTFLAVDRVALTPRAPRLAEWVSRIVITLGGETRIPVAVRLEEPGGDVTEIAFRDLVVNPPLDDAAFAP